jgi:Uma2 family endonuclease
MGTPASLRWTSADLELLPDDDRRYEIIDGELYVSRQPHWHHQVTCGNLYTLLQGWSRVTGRGEANLAPGVIFADDDDVAPDVVWISAERLQSLLDDRGHVRGAPELVIEVLSPGSVNEQRDREAKFKLYARRGVDEYWIVDWRARTVDIFRPDGAGLALVEQVGGEAEVTSPLLPDFRAPLAEVFPRR